MDDVQSACTSVTTGNTTVPCGSDTLTSPSPGPNSTTTMGTVVSGASESQPVGRQLLIILQSYIYLTILYILYKLAQPYAILHRLSTGDALADSLFGQVMCSPFLSTSLCNLVQADTALSDQVTFTLRHRVITHCTQMRSSGWLRGEVCSGPHPAQE